MKVFKGIGLVMLLFVMVLGVCFITTGCRRVSTGGLGRADIVSTETAR